jgi:hypothetical protein
LDSSSSCCDLSTFPRSAIVAASYTCWIGALFFGLVSWLVVRQPSTMLPIRRRLRHHPLPRIAQTSCWLKHPSHSVSEILSPCVKLHSSIDWLELSKFATWSNSFFVFVADFLKPSHAKFNVRNILSLIILLYECPNSYQTGLNATTSTY